MHMHMCSCACTYSRHAEGAVGLARLEVRLDTSASSRVGASDDQHAWGGPWPLAPCPLAPWRRGLRRQHHRADAFPSHARDPWSLAPRGPWSLPPRGPWPLAPRGPWPLAPRVVEDRAGGRQASFGREGDLRTCMYVLGSACVC